MNLHDPWVALRHGGNLLSPAALDGLPDPGGSVRRLADDLRAALIALDPAKPASAALGALLGVVLEDACGLRDGWRKGNALGAADAEKLLDGTVLKPRWRWTGPEDEALVVFTTPAMRIGVGKGRRPVAQAVEYLRRRALPLGLVTNGRQWRLVWADADSLAWVEWEADRWLAGDQISGELAVMRRVLSAASLLRQGTEAGPLLTAIRDSRRGQAKLSGELGERVRRAVETVLRSRQPLVGPAWQEHDSADLYVAACHFVMRLVVTLFAEARELLPVDNPVYHRAYGLRALLDQLDRQTPERRRARHMAWPRLLALFRLLHEGSPHPAVTLPAYGGELFRPGDPEGDSVQRALALLEALPEPPDDDVIHRVLVLLTRTTQRVREGAGWRRVAAPVDFTELTSEYIGILYEGLLDYELHRAGDEPVLFLNLGDQPALPLDRLEAMDDKALAGLVEKAKVKKQAATAEDGEGDEDGGEDEPEDAEDSGDEEAEGESDGSEETTPADDEEPDDARAAARARALAWGRRAVDVGNLIRKPRGRRNEAQAAYEAQRDAAAQQLVADVKLPGELYLVRWGGTRKGAGTFYTRPQLTLPTVRRTLESHIHDGAESEPLRLRAPEALLSLKVCDPAMGSGSFLVAALRVLTEAVTASLHIHGRIERSNGQSTVRCELLPDADRSLPTEGFEERLEAIVRRAVVEHCLYGVDKDPLAVELARVALWVETLDRRLPFTFLDHKLRCGDALVGTWLDRFRDYPLLAWWRQSPDEKWRGVTHDGDMWHKALKEKRKQIVAEQVTRLQEKTPLFPSAVSEDEVKAAIERVRELYRRLRKVPASQPDKRAEIWRKQVAPDPALARVREACDTWCALWFWPLERLDAAPTPASLLAPSAEARAIVAQVRERQRFFHWELEFPDVFTEPGAGFDAMVGNPPWETLQPQSKEFFSNHDPLYRAYGKQEALRRQRDLFQGDKRIEREWLAYIGEFKDMGNWVKHAAEPFGDVEDSNGKSDVALVPRQATETKQFHRKWAAERRKRSGLSDPAHPFRHQGEGKAYTYKMFVEAGHALLGPGGQFGFVLPSGLYTDKGSAPLRRLLLDRCRWRWLYGFENRNRLFAIHRSFKFCVVIARKDGAEGTGVIRSAFMRHDLEDWSEAKGVLDYPAERVTAFSPKSLSVLEIRSERDLAVLTSIYANSVLLGDNGPDGWGIRYAQGDFNMTSDSNLFIARDKAEAAGYRVDEYGRWIGPEGQVLLPLYQGAMIHQHDPARKGVAQGGTHKSKWEELGRANGRVRVSPRYMMRREDFQAKGQETGELRLAFRDLTNATNSRTIIAALVPRFPCNNKTPFFVVEECVDLLPLSAILNSFAADYVMRQRMSGSTGAGSLNPYVLDDQPLAIRCERRALASIVERLELGMPMFGAASLEIERCPTRSSLALTAHERLRLRCMLDAIVAVIYGLDRDDFAWILKDCDHPTTRVADKAFCRRLDSKGFWRVDKASDPELRHTVLSLAAFDGLTEAMAAAGGRDAGIRAFCKQNGGDGWMLPETLCLADLGLTRTVDAGQYDEFARTPRPVRGRLGERFLDWQRSETPEESWAECERHAKVLLDGMTPAPPQEPKRTSGRQPSLFDQEP